MVLYIKKSKTNERRDIMVGAYIVGGIVGAILLFIMIGPLFPGFEPDVDYDP